MTIYQDKDQRINIVYVDDNQDHIDLVKLSIEKLDVNVTVLNYGYDLLALLSQCRESDLVYPDIILLDYSLPDKNGLEVIDSIYEKFQYLPAPIVLVTAYGSEHLAKEAMRKGAYDYITKDGDFLSTLPEYIKRFLNEKPRFSNKETYILGFKINQLTGPLILSSEINIPYSEDELIRLGILYAATIRQAAEYESEHYRTGLFGPLPVPQDINYQAMIYSTYLKENVSNDEKSLLMFCFLYPTRDTIVFNRKVFEVCFTRAFKKIPAIASISTNEALALKLRLLHCLERGTMPKNIMYEENIKQSATILSNEIEKLLTKEKISTNDIKRLKILKDELIQYLN